MTGIALPPTGLLPAVGTHRDHFVTIRSLPGVKPYIIAIKFEPGKLVGEPGHYLNARPDAQSRLGLVASLREQRTRLGDLEHMRPGW